MAYQIDVVVGNDIFGDRIARGLGAEFIEFKSDSYIDGEPCPRILADYDKIRGARIAVVSRTHQKPTEFDRLMYTHTLERITGNLASEELYGAEYVDVVMPYFVFGRQDHNPRTDPQEGVRVKDMGKDIGYKFLLRNLKAQGARRVVSFHPHFHREPGRTEIEGIEVVSLSAMKGLADYARALLDDSFIVIGPDFNAGPLAEEFAGHLGKRVVCFGEEGKHRSSDDSIDYRETYDAGGSNLAIVDDIVSTFGTIVGATLKGGLQNIGDKAYVFVVNAVLPTKGHGTIRSVMGDTVIKRVIATDTVESDFKAVSVVDDVVEFYKNESQS